MKPKLPCSGLAGVAVIALALAAGPAFAADEHNTVPGLTAAGAPLALHGVDPVALLDAGSRLAGSATHAATHNGVAYYFATAANREAFTRAPQRYAPQYGGFCTYGVSVGKKFDGDPRYAAVVDGRLYVFLSEEIYQAFLADRAGTIAKAAANWPRIEHTAAREL